MTYLIIANQNYFDELDMFEWPFWVVSKENPDKFLNGFHTVPDAKKWLGSIEQMDEAFEIPCKSPKGHQYNHSMYCNHCGKDGVA